MNKNPLVGIQDFGQSVWLDFLSRAMIKNGELQRLIVEDGARGATSNPTTFDEAIGQTSDYNDEIRSLADTGKSAADIYRTIAVSDVQQAADLFRPLYEYSNRKYGFVSLEVNPHIAHDTMRTIDEARQLWHAVNRPNIFIKVPATRAGLPAITELIAGGVNVNVTLLFGLPRYREVAEAFIDGLEQRLGRHAPVDGVYSVASFFLSRIDVMVDPMIEERARAEGPEAEIAGGLVGQIAISSAKLAYQMYREIISRERFRKLHELGARPQHLLWASTGTKNPAYSDVKYVEPLIGHDTINTMPRKTIDAYRDHGHPEARLEHDVRQAREALTLLARIGIDLDDVTQKLENEGVAKFVGSYEELRATINKRSAEPLAAYRGSLPGR